MTELASILLTGLLIPAILWFFRPSQSNRLDVLSKLAKAEADVAHSSPSLKGLVAAEVKAEQDRRKPASRWGVFLIFAGIGTVLAVVILWTQLWYLAAYYQAGNPGASIIGNPDVGIGLAFSTLVAMTVVGARSALSRGPQ